MSALGKRFMELEEAFESRLDELDERISERLDKLERLLISVVESDGDDGEIVAVGAPVNETRELSGLLFAHNACETGFYLSENPFYSDAENPTFVSWYEIPALVDFLREAYPSEFEESHS